MGLLKDKEPRARWMHLKEDVGYKRGERGRFPKALCIKNQSDYSRLDEGFDKELYT